MKKQQIKDYIFPIASTIFVLSISAFIYFFSKGYRFDITSREVAKTGVITIKSKPSNATVYINGNSIGRTPKSRTLDTGIQNISVWKDGYREWSKNIEIFEEKATPIFPYLILENISQTTIWQSELPLTQYWENQSKDFFIFLQQNDNEQYTLWSYRINSPVWNLNPNPMEILTLQTEPTEMQISPNGQLAIMTITEEETTTNYIVELQKPSTLENLRTLDTSELQNHTIYWSKDNRHLILESENEIISIDTNTNLKHTLINKTEEREYLWTTDQEGFFYTIEPLHTQEDTTYIYSLKQTEIDGSKPKYTIEKIYLQKNPDYLQHYRENGEIYPEFTNSPESTQTIGQIISFAVNQSANGVYIKTDSCAYWYDIETNRYRMITPHSADLIEFSPDFRKLLFGNGGYIYTFTFDKEEEDHTEILGSQKIDNLLRENISNLHWLHNSTYISYIKDNKFFISEKDAGNTQEIFNTDKTLLSTIKNSLEHIITLEETENTFSINQYRIN